MTEQWHELKETITEMRDNDGTCTQQEACKFLANLMDVLEKQMQHQEPCEDTISREDALMVLTGEWSEPTDELIHQFIRRIKNLPSAQPEIVRCKDCKHREAKNGFCKGRGWPMQLVPDDGFCDKGKRRDESRSENLGGKEVV